MTDGDVLHLEVAGGSVRAPALIAPGHADDAIALALGYGRSGDGEELARGVATNAYALASPARSGLGAMSPPGYVRTTRGHSMHRCISRTAVVARLRRER